MSRIHEALKRAELERAAGRTAQVNDRQAEYAFDRSAIETEPSTSSILHPDDLPQLHSARTETETVHDLIRFDELWAKCSQARWKPDPTSIVFENADSFYPGTEQFRTLRSRLYRMRETQTLQTILISSAIPAEGKTMVAANLAYALVRQPGCRVLLIDADLRSPRIHVLMGAPAAPGLADYLQDTATEFEITQRCSEEGLCFIPAGNHARHPSELISSVRMKQFLERVRPAFDWIIIDSPPAIPVADASVLGGLVDGVLFVVRANSTPSEASLKGCKELRDAHIIGVVLNTAEESAGYNSYYATSVYTNPQHGSKK
jgi:capsular exopolysaccharide synthesis family protein